MAEIEANVSFPGASADQRRGKEEPGRRSAAESFNKATEMDIDRFEEILPISADVIIHTG
jgi:hypothetical protein